MEQQKQTEFVNTIHQACRNYSLDFSLRKFRGNVGANLGLETGNSLEFRDFRDYAPGDDIRNIDWVAFGRTDQLMVRVYQDEIAPLVEVVLDQSCSMGVDEGKKADLALELAGFFKQSAVMNGGRGALFLSGARFLPHEKWETVDFSATSSMALEQPAYCASQLKSNGIRVLISDFMTPSPIAPIVQHFSTHHTQLVVVHILSAWENDPPDGGRVTLVDSETQQKTHLTLNGDVIQRYLRRLALIKSTLQDACQKNGAAYVEIITPSDLLQCLGEFFLPLGLVKMT